MTTKLRTHVLFYPFRGYLYCRRGLHSVHRKGGVHRDAVWMDYQSPDISIANGWNHYNREFNCKDWRRGWVMSYGLPHLAALKWVVYPYRLRVVQSLVTILGSLIFSICNLNWIGRQFTFKNFIPRFSFNKRKTYRA